MSIRQLIIGILLILMLSSLYAEDLYKPYIMADITGNNVISTLESNGFEIVGEYTPYDNAKIIIFTSDAIKKIASQTKNGIFGSALRIAVTDKDITYTNPKYWGYAYRLKSDMNDLYKKLSDILGNKGEFGSKKGLSEKKLRKYHYMMSMPYFTDLVKIGDYKNHKEAVETLENALRKSKCFIYKMDIADKNETLFGTAIKGEHDGADKVVMTTLNSFTKGTLHTAYLPYEILVEGKSIYILNGKFRIALSFPDLTMGQFMKIKNAPKNIKKSVINLLK